MRSSAVEVAAAVSATVEVGTAMIIAAVSAAVTTIEIAMAVISSAMTVIPAASVISPIIVAISATVAAIIVAMAIIAVVPGAGADEDATYKPVRAVVSVGSAGVRIIIVVAVGADWRGAVINGSADSDAEGDALGVRVGGRQETNRESYAEETEQPQVPHFHE
jgi:hypothetical protein